MSRPELRGDGETEAGATVPLLPSPLLPSPLLPSPLLPSPASPRALAERSPEAWTAALVAAGARPEAAQAAVVRLFREVVVGDTPFEAAIAGAPRWLQAQVASWWRPPPTLQLRQCLEAADATLKLAIEVAGGDLIEAVVIPSRRGAAGGRVTVCVSSQVGCGRRCSFCATGALGLRRQLDAAEIVGQLRLARQVWAAKRASSAVALPAISNVVFMGMGEPLDNLEAVCTAIEVMTSDGAFGLAAGRVTVSTIGVAERVAAFTARSKARLALSLHAPDDARRRALMPVHRHTDLSRLRTALLAALAQGPVRGREVLVAYILIDGFNDADADADALADWLAGMPARLNLIPANPGPDPRLAAPPDERVQAFRARLVARGVRALVRWPHGREIGGACGQLAARLSSGDAARGGPRGRPWVGDGGWRADSDATAPQHVQGREEAR